MKTLNLIKSLFMALLFLAIMTGCQNDEFFELENPPEDPWESVDDFEMALQKPYGELLYSGWGGGLITDWVRSEAMSDMIYMIPKTSESYPQNEYYYRQTDIRTGRADAFFKSCYAAINDCNDALNFYSQRNEDDHSFNSLSSAEKNELTRFIGELHFLRGYAYFLNTLRNAPPPGASGFASEKRLPWRKEWELDQEKLRTPEMVSAKKIYKDIIIPDLRKAISMIPESYIGTDQLGRGRANKYAAKFALAQVFFQLGPASSDFSFHPWDSAAYYFNDIIESGKYSLEADPVKPFLHSSIQISDEVILEAVYYDEELNKTPKDVTLFTWNKYRALVDDPSPVRQDTVDDILGNRCEWHVFALSDSALAKTGWFDNDLKINESAANADKRFKQQFIMTSLPDTRPECDPDDPAYDPFADCAPGIEETKFPWVKKSHLLWIDKYFRGETGKYTNVPVFRLPEAYLTLAIIENQRDVSSYVTNDDDGLDEMNTIRNRAGLTDDPNGVATLKEIESECIKELSGEAAFRFRYLLALEKAFGTGGDDSRDEMDPSAGDKLYWPIPKLEEDFQDFAE